MQHNLDISIKLYELYKFKLQYCIWKFKIYRWEKEAKEQIPECIEILELKFPCWVRNGQDTPKSFAYKITKIIHYMSSVKAFMLPCFYICHYFYNLKLNFNCFVVSQWRYLKFHYLQHKVVHCGLINFEVLLNVQIFFAVSEMTHF